MPAVLIRIPLFLKKYETNKNHFSFHGFPELISKGFTGYYAF